jgi:NADH:ubiquinone reductase (H+-translocating)
VLALGSVSHFFGVEGAEEHAFPLKTMEDAVPLRHRILSSFEKAVGEGDPEQRRRLLTFAIVGGGPTGVEFSGALAELIRGPLRRDYPMIDPDEVRVVLIEAIDRLLVGMPEKLSRYAKRAARAAERGGAARFRTRAPSRRTRSSSRTAPSSPRTVIWTAGRARGARPVRRGDCRWDGAAAIPVSSTRSRSTGTRRFAWQETSPSAPKWTVSPSPGWLPSRSQQGHTGRGQHPAWSSRGSAPYPLPLPGSRDARHHRSQQRRRLGARARVQGFFAWILWLVVHIAKLIGFRNRVLVLTNWAWNYLFPKRAVRLVLPEGRSPHGRE